MADRETDFTAKGQFQQFAHGAVVVWGRLTYSDQAPGDAARLQALVDAIRPSEDEWENAS